METSAGIKGTGFGVAQLLRAATPAALAEMPNNSRLVNFVCILFNPKTYPVPLRTLLTRTSSEFSGTVR